MPSWKGKKKTLRKLMSRQHLCAYCGIVLTKLNRTIDHVIPRCLGGTSHRNNLVLCCIQCNNRKGNQLLIPKYAERKKENPAEA